MPLQAVGESMGAARVPSVDEFVTRAQDKTGLDDFGPDGWQDGLEVLVESANAEADLSEIGVRVFASWVNQRLRNRLRVIDWAVSHRDEAMSPIRAPLVVTGLGRSGTTYLLELLAADRANRALMKWEALDAIPPPSTETFDTDPRIAATIDEVERTYAAAPALRAVHYEPGDGPTECLALLGQSFRGADFPGLYTVPSYLAWYLVADHRAAYEFHRIALGVLQSRSPGPWVLKDPWHLVGLDALFAVYPDVRVVVLHRDPASVIPSMAALSVATSADMMRTTPVAAGFWGRQSLDALAVAADRGRLAREQLPEAQFLDLAYDDFIADPLGTVARIYAFAGRPLSAVAETAVGAHVANRPQHKYGVNRYTPADFNLRADEIRDRFADYSIWVNERISRP